MLRYNFLSSDNLVGDGSFDSEECVVQSGRCDVIVSKPPLEEFNEYFGLIAKSEKTFILIAPFCESTEFNLFRNIKHNKAKIGNLLDFKYVSYDSSDNSEMTFDEIYEITNINLLDRPCLFNTEDVTKQKTTRKKRTHWKRSATVFVKEKSTLVSNGMNCYCVFEYRLRKQNKQKSEQEVSLRNELQAQIKSKFKSLDNYDAIVVDDLSLIPRDYDGVIAVPLNYLKQYNPFEFEIVGLSKKDLNKEESLKFDLSSDNVLPVIEGVKEDVMRVFITRRKHWASKDLDWYRDNIFKKYTEDELVNQLNEFVNQEHDLSDISNKGKSYNKIINQFLEEVIYSARKSKVKYSPVDSLNDDALLTRIINYIESKPRFFSDTNPIINLKRFYSGACKIAPKVANFSPNAACKIYERLCPKKNANIYDYSCGFGARMLGCICSKNNYNYFGTDPNERLCVQLNKLGEAAPEQKPNRQTGEPAGSAVNISKSEHRNGVWKAGRPRGQHERWWKALLKPSVVPGPSSGPRRWRTRLVSLLVGEAGRLVPPLGILAQETCFPGFRAQESSSALAGLCFSWLQRGGEWKGWIKCSL